MCTTFVVRYMCGHECRRTVVRCAQAIRTQLALAETAIDEDPSTTRSGCVCDIDLPEEYLKPDICEQCETKGLICDYLDKDPSAKFNVIKEWRAQKRAQRNRQARKGSSEDADLMEKLEFVASSSVSSLTSSDPQTPTSGSQSLCVHIPEIDLAFDEAGLKSLSPASGCFDTTLVSGGTNLNHSRFEAEADEDPNFVSRHTRCFDDARVLRRRCTALTEKLQHCVAESRRKQAAQRF